VAYLNTVSDFRRTSKLVRDCIPEIIAAVGRVIETTTFDGNLLDRDDRDGLIQDAQYGK